MEIITEDTIRRLLRKKELRDGGCFVLKTKSMITPSAQSYLREHRIDVNYLEVKGSTQKPAPSSQADKKQAVTSNELKIAYRHLVNMFYFPDFADDFLTAEWWLYLEQQQKWLLSLGEIPVQPAPKKPLIISGNHRRWAYAVGEIECQIDCILMLLSDEPPQKYQRFVDWSQQLLTVLAAVKKE